MDKVLLAVPHHRCLTVLFGWQAEFEMVRVEGGDTIMRKHEAGCYNTLMSLTRLWTRPFSTSCTSAGAEITISISDVGVKVSIFVDYQ